MTQTLSTIRPHVDLILKQLTTLSAVAIDTTSSVSQLVQKLLSNTGFVAAALTSDGKPQVVVVNFPIYEQIRTLVNSLPEMFGLIQLHKSIAAGGATLLGRAVILMGVGTVLTIAGVYKIAKIATHQNYTAAKNDKAYRWKAVALIGISAIIYSMFMTSKVGFGLQEIA